jgi:hypothetical protein
VVTLTRSVPVNAPGQAPLTRGQLWQALLLKVEDATLFVPGMTHCRVLERRDNEVVREIVWRGQPRRQRVTLQPEHTVEFEHLSGNARGRVLNQIEEDAAGALHLRFTFLLDAIEGIAPGSAEEQAYGERMKEDYLGAVQATLETARRLMASGRLAPPAASGARSS